MLNTMNTRDKGRYSHSRIRKLAHLVIAITCF